jgi:alanine dehydrogenase
MHLREQGGTMPERRTYLITQAQVMSVLTIAEALSAVEEAFRAYGEGNVQMPPKLYLHFPHGDLRCMPASIAELGVASVKNVNVHPANSDLPTVMAGVTLFDPETGFPLAIMDATHLTAMRTGAAGGIAARHLARPDSKVAAFAGAGRQAETQLAALVETMRELETVLAYDLDEGRAAAFARHAAAAYGLQARACGLEEAVRSADILTTVTPAREPFVKRAYVRPGTHINAIGADAPGKQELATGILLDARVVVDSREQASHAGEINVAMAGGALKLADINADIGEVVTGRKPGRGDDQEITVFDSTGLAIQDCACAAHVFRRLMEDPEMAEQLATFDFLAQA